jgi:hypothetical protein
MAREHANVRLDMWGDRDWRALTSDAQRLYLLLLTHPETNRAGVSDWRPGRLSQMCSDKSADDVRETARELIAKYFIAVDEVTEEVLIRSFVKYDGVLKQPNMTVTMVNDWTGVASERLRGIVAFEVKKIRGRFPDWTIWSNPKLETLLEHPGIDIRIDPSVDPRADPSVDPKAKASVRGASTTTSTSTTTNASHSAAKKPELRIPKDWAPTADHIKRAKEMKVDVVAEADNFRLHAETHDRHAANWNAAFTTWLKKARPSTPKPSTRRVPANDEWMYR